MADTVKSANELKIVWDFADDDTRTDTFQNPRSDLAAEELKNLSAFVAENHPIIGDKTGAAVVGIKEASVINKTKLDLDLTLLS